MTPTPGELMEQKMLATLEGTWRTWQRGDSVSFNFVTEEKRPDWTPNYWKIMAGGQGCKTGVVGAGFAHNL